MTAGGGWVATWRWQMEEVHVGCCASDYPFPTLTESGYERGRARTAVKSFGAVLCDGTEAATRHTDVPRCPGGRSIHRPGKRDAAISSGTRAAARREAYVSAACGPMGVGGVGGELPPHTPRVTPHNPSAAARREDADDPRGGVIWGGTVRNVSFRDGARVRITRGPPSIYNGVTRVWPCVWIKFG